VKTRSEYGSCPCCVIPQGRQYGSRRADAGCQNDLSRHIIWTISYHIKTSAFSHLLLSTCICSWNQYLVSVSFRQFAKFSGVQCDAYFIW